jgi:Ca2+-binding RTX toxin-like protein
MASYTTRGAVLSFSAPNGGSNQALGRVVGLRDNGFAVTWLAEDAERTTFDGDLYGYVFNANLTATTANPRTLVTDTGPAPSYPVLQDSTASSNGGFALISTDNARFSLGEATSKQEATVRLYDSTGNAIGSPVYLGLSSPIGVTITTLGDGRLVAGWVDNDGALRAQYLTADGALSGSSFVVALPGGDFASRPVFSAVGPSGWVATYVAQGQAQGNAVFYDAAGTASSSVPVSTNMTSIQGIESSKLADGGSVLVWTRVNASQQVETRAQIFTASGEKLGTELNISSGNSSVTSVAGLSGGGFVIATEAGSTVELRFYNAIGQVAAVPIILANAREPSVSALADGGFVLSWQEGSTFKAQAYQAVAASAQNLNGTAGADTLVGQEANDALFGLAGEDRLFGSVGNDALYGGDNVDSLYGGAGADYLDGGTGADKMFGSFGDDVYVADNLADQVSELTGEGVDRVYALVSGYTLTAGSEVEILAAGGSDANVPLTLVGNEKANNLWGNSGANALYGAAGADALFGYAGADYLDGGSGADFMVGGTGDDVYVVETSGDVVSELAGEGMDTVYVLTEYFALSATSAVEVITVGGPDPAAPYTLVGNELTNNIVGSAGVNALYGGGGNDALFGYAGNDYLDGGTGPDLLVGGVGNDTYIIDDGSDIIDERAGEGSDRVYALTSFQLNAGASIEEIFVGGPNPTAQINLTGNELANNLVGNAGFNWLNGGAGNDYLRGEGGPDNFAFSSALSPQNIDFIADFTSGLDKIALDDAVFTGLSGGTLSASAFANGNATTADHRIIFQGTTGALLFDADGNGAGAAVQFASVSAGLTLQASDFFVI